MQISSNRLATLLLGAVVGVPWVGGCASIPKGHYGVGEIDWEGTHAMSSVSLANCIATRERESFQLKLGSGGTQCGSPPFDQEAPSLSLWTWPWVTWPVYDPAIFEIDHERIERWYQARGYYQARVLDVKYELDGEPVTDPQRCEGDECELSLTIHVEEGEPVTVREVEVAADATLPLELRAKLSKLPQLRVGERFDEALFEADKVALVERLKEASYAQAQVQGAAGIDRNERTAVVRYTIIPGPASRFGTMRVEGHGELDAELVMRVADLVPGDPYEQSELADAEAAVYALGAFSSVRIEPQLVPGEPVVDLLIRVSPGRLSRWRLGVGVMSGTLQRGISDEIYSVPQWDVHLKVGFRHENFLGGMRKLRIEDRPRLIMQRAFPEVPPFGPRLGNSLLIELEQPEFLEARTVFFVSNQWDLGPDAYFGYFRHDLATKLGLRRAFLRQRVRVELAVQHDLYEIISNDAPDTVSSYRLPFFEQDVRLDFRNDSQRPSRGFYAATTLQEAVRLGYGSWDYLRLLVEGRAYQRLPLRIVLAQRLAFGALFILDSAPELDPTSFALGPQTYRLRGGGANSNRGFGAGELGDGVDGGQRRWEGAFDVRVPLSESLGFVLFFDVGDVSRGARVRFEHINASAGFGLRYFTFFAPIRFDAGWRIPGAQVIGKPDPSFDSGVLPSAVHLTIGEAF